MLDDHVKKHGPTTTVPCTSQDCSWNKGKKRKKEPKRISSVNYPNKKKKSRPNVIDFDPRPVEYREINENHINKFVKNLQSIGNTELSMWETQLKITYNDYQLDREREKQLKNEKMKSYIATLLLNVP